MGGLSSRSIRLVACLVALALAAVALGLPSIRATASAASGLPSPAPGAVTAIWDQFHFLDGIAYSSASDRLYASNEFGSVSIISGSTKEVVEELHSFVSPASLVYDPEANELFVGDEGSYSVVAGTNVSIVDLTTNRVVRSFWGAEPYGIVYDHASHAVFIQQNGSVLVLDARTNAVKRTIGGLGGFRPQGYDPVRDLLFGLAAQDIAAVNLSQDLVVWTTPNVPIGTYPIGYDPLNRDVYIMRLRGQEFDVDVLDGSTGATVATIPRVSIPQAYLFDPANGDMYISASGSTWGMVVVNASLNIEVARVGLSAPPGEMAYDSADQNVYVACTYPVGNGTGVILVLPSTAYPLPNPWLSILGTMGQMTVVGGVIALASFLAARWRDRRGPRPKRPGPFPYREPREPW